MPLDRRDPTNGELAIMIDGMRQTMTEHNSSTSLILGKIEAKVDHTNGRVRKLEEYKLKIVGGWIVISALMLFIVVPIIVSYLSNFVD